MNYGFTFWLQWILWFGGSLLAAALFWTFLLTSLFGAIQNTEIVITWGVGVFGSWFLLLTPFMRKKEQIWKRLNQDQEKAVDVWLLGIGVFIFAVMLALIFWGWFYKAEILREHSNLYGSWLKSSGLTILILNLPLLLWMYRKADRIFQDAVIRQTAKGPAFKTAFVEQEKRLLSQPLREKISTYPETLSGGHVVRFRLKNGREIPHAFVIQNRELLGLYDFEKMDFTVEEIVDAMPLKPEELPAYDETKWLRLDTNA